MADEDLIIGLGADTSGLDQAEQAQLRFLDRYNQHVRDAAAQTPELTARVNVDDLGRFRQELRAAADDATRTRQLFTGFAQGVDTELRALGVTGPEAARVINLVWSETVKAAQAADAARLPIASLTSGLQNLRGFLPAGPTRFELGAGEQAAEVRLLSAGLQEVHADLVRIRALSTELRQQPLLPPAPRGPAGLIGPGTPPPAIPTLLASQDDTRLIQEAEEAERARRSLEGLRETMLQQGQAARTVAGDNEQAAAAIAGVGRSTAGVETGAPRAATGLNTVRSAAVALAAAGAGLSGQLGSIATGFALLAGAPAGVIIGIAGLAIGLELATRKTREARQATDEYIKAQVEAARARDAIGQVRDVFQGVDESGRQIEGLTQRMSRLNEELRKAREGETVGTPDAGDVNVGVNQADVERKLQAIRDVKTAAIETGRNFLEPIIQAQLAATQQALQDENALTQAGIQTREQGLRVSYQLQLTDAQTFFRERQRLAQEAASADLTALRGELRAQENRSTAGFTPAETAAHDATIAHLRAQIALRETILGQQVQSIRNEEALAQQLLLERAGIGIPRQPGDTGAPDRLEDADLSSRRFRATLQLKPELDATELNRALDELNARAAQGQLDDELERARRAGEALFPILTEIGLRIEDIGNANITGPTDALRDSLDDVLRGLDQLAAAASNIGLIDEQASRAIGSVLNLASALDQVAQSASFGNVVGAIGAGLSFIGQIAGPSEAERLQLEATRENSRRLAELSQELHNNVLGIGGQARAGEAAAALTGAEGFAARARSIQLTEQFSLGRDAANAAGIAFLDDQVRRFGVTFEDLNRIARENGIQLLDQNGRIVAGAFDDLAKATGISIEAMTSFANTFDEQQRRLDLGSRLRGEPQDDRSKFEREIQAAIGLSPAFQQAFQGVDLGNQEAVRQASLGIFNQLDTGFFTEHPELLGNLSKADVLRLLDDSAGFLDSFNQGLVDATKNLQNVPDLTKLGELEFSARATAFAGDGAALPIPFRELPVTPQPLGSQTAELRGTPDLTAAARSSAPIVDRLAQLSGGATLKDLLDVLVGARPTGSGGAGTATGRLAQVIHNYYGDTVVRFDQPPANAEEAARVVTDAQTQHRLATSNRED